MWQPLLVEKAWWIGLDGGCFGVQCGTLGLLSMAT